MPTSFGCYITCHFVNTQCLLATIKPQLTIVKLFHCLGKSAKNNTRLFAAFIDFSQGFDSGVKTRLGITQHEVNEDAQLLVFQWTCF